MLTTLRIKNLGLVDDITLELGPGFTTMTGETGAGKSMIIGALNLILGQRADRKSIRSGTDLCMVEAVFDIKEVRAPIVSFLEENGLEPCEQDQLLIKRSVASSGNNRQFVNHSPASLQLLSTLGRWLVDIHGPYDHQSLFDPNTQLALLDAYAGATESRKKYSEIVHRVKTLQSEKAALITDEQSYAQQLDLLRFQTQEIVSARLDELDETALEDDFQRTQNAAQIRGLGSALQAALSESEPNLIELVAQVGQALHQLSQLDPQIEPLVEAHIQLADTAEDLQTQLSRYLDTVEINPGQLAQLEEQINGLQSLKRKYGPSIEAILEFGDQAAKRLRALESRDVEVERIDRMIESHLNDLAQLGGALSQKRKQNGTSLAQATAEQLTDLGFEEGRFEVQVTQDPANLESGPPLRPTGLDQIEFLFGPNPGEPLHPLKKIASSGEIARVMLALKTVLATEDSVPLLVFDEVDANVGGETAHAVGEKMRLLGQRHQVICITHLAPVAATANQHFRVTKKSDHDRTLTRVDRLNRPDRITELGRMLGGKITAAKQHAEALLKSRLTSQKRTASK